MKILKGFYQGIEIAVPTGGQVRPTVDHFKKNVFGLLPKLFPELDWPDLVVWDLFAGSGGVGLEFLSRGVKNVVFVEHLKSALDCIKLNLAECRLKDATALEAQNPQLIQASADAFLKKPDKFGITQSPDLVFLDPPYGTDWMERITPLLLACPLATAATYFFAEHVIEDYLPEIAGKAQIIEEKQYGPKVLSIFKKLP